MLTLPHRHRNSSAIPWHLKHQCFISWIQFLTQHQTDCKVQQITLGVILSKAELSSRNQKTITNTCKVQEEDQKFLSFSASCGTPAAPRPKAGMEAQVTKSRILEPPLLCSQIITHTYHAQRAPGLGGWVISGYEDSPCNVKCHSTPVKFCAWQDSNHRITEEHTTRLLNLWT